MLSPVVVAYPHSQNVSAKFAESLLGLVMKNPDERLIMPLGATSGPGISIGRNFLVRRFLQVNAVAEWLCWIDTDMVFEDDIIERLVASADPTERPVMGALCFSLSSLGVAPVLFRHDEGHLQRLSTLPAHDGVHRLLAGTGCLLVHRTVFERLQQHFDPPYEWFQETTLDGNTLSEDLTFAMRCESIGIPVHVDTRVSVGHERAVVLDRAFYETLLKTDGAHPLAWIVHVQQSASGFAEPKPDPTVSF